jgi:hypothetical protein
VWVEAAAQNRSLNGRDSERETITPIEFLAATGAGRARRCDGRASSHINERFLVSVPSWWQAPLSDEAAEAFILKTVNLGGERESLFLGGLLIFVWSAPHGFVVVGIHDNYNPPTIVLITSDADLDGVLLHVRFVQVD